MTRLPTLMAVRTLHNIVLGLTPDQALRLERACKRRGLWVNCWPYVGDAR